MNTKYYVPLLVAAAIFARPASAAFCWDDADQDAYAQQFAPGLNGGVGFLKWEDLNPGDGTTFGGPFLVPDSFHSDEQALRGPDHRSWAIYGTSAVGRELVDELSSGTWTFLAAHHVKNTFNMGFSGFNLTSVKSSEYADFAEGELIRFGYDDWDSANKQEGGICYSVNSGLTYTFLGGADWKGCRLQYSVSWNGQGTYTLIVENLDSEDEPIRKTIHTALQSGPVAMLGTAIYGDDLNAGSIVFDAYEVIPEPAGAMPVLALTVFAMALRRSR
ncbi:MAG TPA: hypothetical protein PKM43_08835 [Verrucomicrobiota bacterium]|nr:hypothetical protein [Verrucomicrobiota bacterium]